MAKMNSISINISDDIFAQTDHNYYIDTPINISNGDVFFPDALWTDFTYPMIYEWTEVLITHRFSKGANYQLHFTDGPYFLQIHQDKQRLLHIRGFRTEEAQCHFECECTYADFLSALYNAAKALNRILDSSGLRKKGFETVFCASVEYEEKLKTLLQEETSMRLS